jgi:hypothetical protein
MREWAILPSGHLPAGKMGIKGGRRDEIGRGTHLPSPISPPPSPQNELDLSSLDCKTGFYCPTPAQQLACPPGSYCVERTVTPLTCDYNKMLNTNPYESETAVWMCVCI